MKMGQMPCTSEPPVLEAVDKKHLLSKAGPRTGNGHCTTQGDVLEQIKKSHPSNAKYIQHRQSHPLSLERSTVPE